MTTPPYNANEVILAEVVLRTLVKRGSRPMRTNLRYLVRHFVLMMKLIAANGKMEDVISEVNSIRFWLDAVVEHYSERKGKDGESLHDGSVSPD